MTDLVQHVDDWVGLELLPELGPDRSSTVIFSWKGKCHRERSNRTYEANHSGNKSCLGRGAGYVSTYRPTSMEVSDERRRTPGLRLRCRNQVTGVLGRFRRSEARPRIQRPGSAVAAESR